MHVDELEAYRMEKEHKMRHGYQDHSNKKYPHTAEEKREEEYNELGPALMHRHNAQKTRKNAEDMVKEGKEKYGLKMEIE
jgi:hypothetical protein